MNIAIVGTGYVGLVSGTCFADTGANVTCVDVDANKIERLQEGIIPIYEPGLDELVKKNVAAGRLKFTTDLASVLNDVEIVFSAVGTPPDEDGSADLKYVLQVAKTIGENLNKYVVVVTKSTVPVGTAKKVRQTIENELARRGVDIEFDVASNPEFLKEGNAIKGAHKALQAFPHQQFPRDLYGYSFGRDDEICCQLYVGNAYILYERHC